MGVIVVGMVVVDMVVAGGPVGCGSGAGEKERQERDQWREAPSGPWTKLPTAFEARHIRAGTPGSTQDECKH